MTDKMKARRIDGVVLTDLRQITDDRGAVLHMLRSDSPGFEAFGECYLSEIKPGIVKAWKRHKLQTQNLAVPAGRIRIVLYDDRPGSSSKGMLLVYELGRPDAYKRIRIPANVWYGFACISNLPALIINCTDIPHRAEETETRSVDEHDIPYQWNRDD